MAQLVAAILVYGPPIATMFAGSVVGGAGLYFTRKQVKFAEDQPKRDLETYRRAFKAAKHMRLIDDFAVILRHSMATKEYIRWQNVVILGEDTKEQEQQLLEYLSSESKGLSLAIAKARLEGVDTEILKIIDEQYMAVNKFAALNKKLFELLDNKVSTDLTFLSNKVDEARALAIQKYDELEAILKRKLDELENPEAV